MKRLINLALLIAFQFCYLEWPPNNSMFIYEGEAKIFSMTDKWMDNFTHPVILLGLLAQILVLLGAMILNFNKRLNSLGVVLLGILVLLFFVVGLMSSNYKIVGSTLPYLVLEIYYFMTLRKKVN